MALLLTRLGVDRLLQDLKSSQPASPHTTHLKLVGLKDPDHSPFEQKLYDDLTPRTHYDWQVSGNDGRTSDPKYKTYLLPYLRTLFQTNDEVIYTSGKHIKLMPKVRIFIHRKSSYKFKSREYQIMEWGSVNDQKSEIPD